MIHRLPAAARRHVAAATPCHRHAAPLVATALMAVTLAGCGTTSGSDTKRTATEQLLVSDAIERAVMQADMSPLAGRRVFLDTTVLSNVDDKDYLESTVRQYVLGSGCVLAEKRDDAEIIVEARAGAIGTDRNGVILGIPATSIQLTGNGMTIPEIALLKRSDQRAVAKINLFAYDRASGTPVWQGGAEHVASHSRDRWFFGAGPFQDGRIHDRVEFAGRKVRTPWGGGTGDDETAVATFDIMEPRIFAGGRSATAARTADARPADLPPVR